MMHHEMKGWMFQFMSRKTRFIVYRRAPDFLRVNERPITIIIARSHQNSISNY